MCNGEEDARHELRLARRHFQPPATISAARFLSSNPGIRTRNGNAQVPFLFSSLRDNRHIRLPISSFQHFRSGKNPCRFMGFKSNPWIIRFCFRCGQQNDLRPWTQSRLGQPDEFAADSPPLVACINGEIREVTAILKICDGTGHPHKFLIVPRRTKKICVLQHGTQATGIIHRATLRQCRTSQKITEVFRRNSRRSLVTDIHSFTGPKWKEVRTF